MKIRFNLLVLLIFALLNTLGQTAGATHAEASAQIENLEEKAFIPTLIIPLVSSHPEDRIQQLIKELGEVVPEFVALGNMNLIIDAKGEVPSFVLSDAFPEAKTHLAAMQSCPAGSVLANESQLDALGGAMTHGKYGWWNYQRELIPGMQTFWGSGFQWHSNGYYYRSYPGYFDAEVGNRSEVGNGMGSERLLAVRCVRPLVGWDENTAGLASDTVIQLVERNPVAGVDPLIAHLKQNHPNFFSKQGGAVGRAFLIRDPDGEVPPFVLGDQSNPLEYFSRASKYCGGDSNPASKAQLEALARALNVGGKYNSKLLPALKNFYSSEHIYSAVGSQAYYFNRRYGFVDVGNDEEPRFRCVVDAQAFVTPAKKAPAQPQAPNPNIIPLIDNHEDPRVSGIIQDLKLHQPRFFKMGGKEGRMVLVLDPDQIVPPFVVSDDRSYMTELHIAGQYCEDSGAELPSKEQFYALQRALGGKYHIGKIVGYDPRPISSLANSVLWGRWVKGGYTYVFDGRKGEVDIEQHGFTQKRRFRCVTSVKW